MRKKLIVDIGGADASCDCIAGGALLALENQNEYDLVIAGPADVIKNEISIKKADSSRIEIIEADEFVTNYDNPKKIVTGFNETSMVKALLALKNREDIAGMVSAGSTGCLMVGSIFRLGLLGKLMQPALSCALYNVNWGYFCLADCGANINCKPKDLLDYAKMGSAFMSAMKGISSPAVGLLNVGREDSKGNDLAKEAFALIKDDTSVNFIGNIEGSDVLKGEADVIVCDGFTGNVLLKSMEACGLTAAAMMGNPEKVVKFFDYNNQGGATFLGTKKIIVKAHGAANEETIKSCLNQAWQMECGGFTEKMNAALSC